MSHRRRNSGAAATSARASVIAMQMEAIQNRPLAQIGFLNTTCNWLLPAPSCGGSGGGIWGAVEPRLPPTRPLPGRHRVYAGFGHKKLIETGNSRFRLGEGRRGRRPAELRPVKQGLIVMIILGLFLIHLAEAVAAVVFFEWLVRWLGGATMTEAVLTFTAVSGAVATMIVLV